MGTQLAQIPDAWSDERRRKVHKSRIYDDGFLYLEGDADPWIQHNLVDSLSVRRLELNLRGCSEVRKKGDSIAGQLAELTHVSTCDGFCDVKKIGDSIAELFELTHLSICDSVLLRSVTNILRLHNLQVLKFKYCIYLEALPQNLGELKNLTHLELDHCGAIKSLPNSIADISNLSTLILIFCESLSALPENMNVADLSLRGCCRMQCLPRGLTNLQHLHLQLCSLIEQRFSNFKHAKMIPQLSFSVCRAHPSECHIIKNLPSFVGQHILQRLCFVDIFVDELPTNLDQLPQLLFLDIHQCSNIKHFPCNLKNLPNLRFFHLPSDFRLETLVNTLNDSVIISVEKRHIRKTWKEIQLEMGPHVIPNDRASPPVVEMKKDALGYLTYLSLKDHPSSWILNHYNLRCLVRIMDLEQPDTIEEIGSFLKALKNLTHLYIGAMSNNTDLYTLAKDCFQYLPDTTTRLIHLSLHSCVLDRLPSDSMGKLSSLISLDLCLLGTKLPAALDLPLCLEHLTLRNHSLCLLPDSIAKLSNLNTLELYECKRVTLPENLNITTFKLVCSQVHSLPTSLCHLELVHDEGYCKRFCSDHYNTCLEKVTNLKTLSLTCYRVKFLPCIADLQNLQKLLLKDCFRLETLLCILDESVNLCTLDVSGTRIKSLPECITKLPKVQHLVLPKCYEQKNLPSQFLGNGSNVRIEFDEIDERYYKDVGYYDSTFENSKETLDKHNVTSYDNNDITPCTAVGVNDMLRELGEEGIINVQTSSCRLANPPEATHALGDFHLNGRNFSTGESRHNGSHCLQNQERRIIYSGVHPMEIADMITELSFGIQATDNFGKDREMGTMYLGNEESTITSSNQLTVSSSTHDGNTQQAVIYAQESANPYDTPKMGNRRKKEITRNEIQSLRDERMTLIEAAQKLGVSRSTVKRRCKEHELDEWPSGQKKKSTCTKNRKTNTKLLSGGEISKPSQPNLVECTNQAGPAHANESLDVNPHNLSDQVAPHCHSIDNSAHKATTGSVGELNVASHRRMDIHESTYECTVVTDVHPLSSNVQDSSSSSSFTIKATYKEEIVRFNWSSIACLEELKEAVVENLKIQVDSFRLKYQDEEGDWVSINTNEHLKSALNFVKNNILRLRVTDL